VLTLNAQKVSKLKGDSLFYAPNGINFKNEVHALLNFDNEKELLKIDLQNTNSIDSSFCREGFVNLISELSLSLNRPQVLFINVSENVVQNLEVSFTYHKKYCLIIDKDSKFQIVGKSAEPFRETIEAMIKLKEARVRDVAKELGIEELNTVNNRLKNIFDLCIIKRKEVGQESGGKEFIYYLKT